MIDGFKNHILNSSAFPSIDFVLEVFRYQAKNNQIYNEYLSFLNININTVTSLEDIPFLPIQLFKSKVIKTHDFNTKTIFESSGTTGQITSKHFVKDLPFYQKLCVKLFEESYGPLSDYRLLALLPSYVERSNSSLIYMVDHFMSKTKEGSGFYLNRDSAFTDILNRSIVEDSPLIVIGVSFALLDWAEECQVDLRSTVLMETGGMKGRRKELTREELHQILSASFNLKFIHSEYGMTELLSQSYSQGKGLFETSSSMKILIRELNDPFSYITNGKSGFINIIDLGNIDSCCFIATEDIGRSSGITFEVLGRSDVSEIRGCNLMVQDL